MAKRKNFMPKYKMPGKGRKGKALPTLKSIKVPKGGLLSKSLRRDIGKVPGLA